MILSASRRTDLPCYYSEWFINRLKEGYALSKNPMNPNQVRKIILSPEVIDCIVFWTKDPQNMMRQLPVIDSMGYHYYFQFTLNPYGKEIERYLRNKDLITNTFLRLSEQIGKNRMIWRYDPIIINDNSTISYHLEQFELLCRKLHDYTDVCIISFVDGYSKLNKKVKDEIVKGITEEQMNRIAAGFSVIAHNYGVELSACCEKLDLTSYGIRSSSCIDKTLVERICGHSISERRDKNQRIGCGCVQSVDIGIYNTCRNGCVYCYANHSDISIMNNIRRHDPKSDLMIGAVQQDSLDMEGNASESYE